MQAISKRGLPKAQRLILGLWIPIWIFFLISPILKNPGQLKVMMRLLQSDIEGRRAIVYGPEFYRFLQFCREKLPTGSTFRLVGVDYAAIEKVRAFYHLYPCLVSENPDYILVYNMPRYQQAGADLFAVLDPTHFILKTSQPSLP
jgi:hypothetical protein